MLFGLIQTEDSRVADEGTKKYITCPGRSRESTIMGEYENDARGEEN